jgi:hypothetical protein
MSIQWSDGITELTKSRYSLYLVEVSARTESTRTIKRLVHIVSTNERDANTGALNFVQREMIGIFAFESSVVRRLSRVDCIGDSCKSL